MAKKVKEVKEEEGTTVRKGTKAVILSEVTEVANIGDKSEPKDYYPEKTVKVFNKSNNPLPEYAREGDSGMDVRAWLTSKDCIERGSKYNIYLDKISGKYKLIIYPHGHALIPSGLFVEIPLGFEFQDRSRSGLASNNKVFVLNSPGTIDSPYRGDLGTILYNLGDKAITIVSGDKIAQIVLAPVYKCKWQPVNDISELSVTERQDKGFGHTGI